jgi:hypothetical protein
MGITLSFQGRAPDPRSRAAALALAEEHARAMEWSARPVELRPGQARVGGEWLETPVIAGREFLPHAASEPLPLVFLESSGTLVDLYQRDLGGGAVELAHEILIKTQFAGPDCHVEVCELLSALQSGPLPGLVVDDESGWFHHRDRGRLEDAFAAAWAAIVAEALKGAGPAPVEIGGYTVQTGRATMALREFDRLKPQETELVLNLERLLRLRFGSGIYRFPLDSEGVLDLDLLATDFDAKVPGSGAGSQDDEAALAAGLGAAFGRMLIALHGGTWESDEEDGLSLADLGGVGVRVNPFRLAADRLAQGPAFGFENLGATLAALIRHLRAHAESSRTGTPGPGREEDGPGADREGRPEGGW